MRENRYFADLSPLEHISQVVEPTAAMPPNVIYYSGPTNEYGVGLYPRNKMPSTKASYNKFKFMLVPGSWLEGSQPAIGFLARHSSVDNDAQFCLLFLIPGMSPPTIDVIHIEYGIYNIETRLYNVDGYLDFTGIITSIHENVWNEMEASFNDNGSLNVTITPTGFAPRSDAAPPGSLLLDRRGQNGIIMIDFIGNLPPDAFFLDEWTVDKV